MRLLSPGLRILVTQQRDETDRCDMPRERSRLPKRAAQAQTSVAMCRHIFSLLGWSISYRFRIGNLSADSVWVSWDHGDHGMLHVAQRSSLGCIVVVRARARLRACESAIAKETRPGATWNLDG